MSSRTLKAVVVIALLTVGCSNPAGGRTSEMAPLGSSSLTGPSLGFESDPAAAAPRWGELGTTLKETLSGPAINGVEPEGEALADMSDFVNGGSTILTVRIKNVNLPDGTVLGVTLDFTPVGTITLSRGEGTLTANLGRFGVSRDQVRINDGGATILAGGFFR